MDDSHETSRPELEPLDPDKLTLGQWRRLLGIRTIGLAAVALAAAFGLGDRCRAHLAASDTADLRVRIANLEGEVRTYKEKASSLKEMNDKKVCREFTTERQYQAARNLKAGMESVRRQAQKLLAPHAPTAVRPSVVHVGAVADFEARYFPSDERLIGLVEGVLSSVDTANRALDVAIKYSTEAMSGRVEMIKQWNQLADRSLTQAVEQASQAAALLDTGYLRQQGTTAD